MANKSAASRSVRHQDGYIKERIARHKIIQQDYDGARRLIANRQKGYEITTLLYCHMALNDKKSFKQDLAIAKGNNPNFETHAMRCISNHMRRVFNQYCSLDTKPDARYD